MKAQLIGVRTLAKNANQINGAINKARAVLALAMTDDNYLTIDRSEAILVLELAIDSLQWARSQLVSLPEDKVQRPERR